MNNGRFSAYTFAGRPLRKAPGQTASNAFAQSSALHALAFGGTDGAARVWTATNLRRANDHFTPNQISKP